MIFTGMLTSIAFVLYLCYTCTTCNKIVMIAGGDLTRVSWVVLVREVRVTVDASMSDETESCRAFRIGAHRILSVCSCQVSSSRRLYLHMYTLQERAVNVKMFGVSPT